MINIHKCGFNDQHPANFQIYRPTGVFDYLILLLRNEGYFLLNDSLTKESREIYVPADSIFIYRKGTPQFYGSHELSYIDDWIHFDFSDGEDFNQAFSGIPIESPIVIHDITHIRKIFQQFITEYYNESPFKDDFLNHLFHILIIKIREQLLLPEDTIHMHKLYPVLNRIRNEMKSSPNTIHTVEEAAKKATLAVSYFQHLYKQFFNVTFITDLIKARIELSKYYLAGTKLSVRNISELCGYENEVHYMRQFKKLENMTPGEYRQNYFTGM